MNDRPKRKCDWVGRYVRLQSKHETKGGAIFEAGEVMRVTRNFSGLHLEVIRRCPDCRRRGRERIKGVSEADVRLLPVDYQPEGVLE